MIRRTATSLLVGSVAAATLLAGCKPVAEEGDAFPADDIRLIIQAEPGGGSDLSSRATATELEGSLEG